MKQNRFAWAFRCPDLGDPLAIAAGCGESDFHAFTSRVSDGGYLIQNLRLRAPACAVNLEGKFPVARGDEVGIAHTPAVERALRRFIEVVMADDQSLDILNAQSGIDDR